MSSSWGVSSQAEEIKKIIIYIYYIHYTTKMIWTQIYPGKFICQTYILDSVLMPHFGTFKLKLLFLLNEISLIIGGYALSGDICVLPVFCDCVSMNKTAEYIRMMFG